MADALDFSDLGAPVQAPSALDFSDLGSHPVAGPTGSWTTDVPRRLATAGTDALGGLLALPRAGAQAVDWVGGKMGLNPGADQAMAGIQQPGGGQLFPDANAAREMAYNTTGATEYVPATTAGRYLQAGLAAAPLGLAGGVKAVLPSIAGGATAEAAGELMPNYPVAARLGGFVLGAGTAAGVANSAAKAAGMATGLAPTSDLYQAYQRQGVPTSLSGDVTQNPGLQLAQSMAAKMPGGAEAIRSKVGDTLDGWQAAAERAASQLGPASTMQEAGTSLQGAANQWLQNWKQESNNRWNAFQQAVPGNTPIKVDAFDKELGNVTQNFGGATKLAETLQPGLAAKLQEALSADVSPNGTLPWQAVQATRSALGEMMQGAPVADAPQAAIKRLYGALSDDMRNGAAQAGPTASRAFNDANAYTAFGHMMIEDHLKPILSAVEPEKAAQYALSQARSGGSRLNAIDFAMPGEAANLGAAVLRQATTNSADGSVTPGALPNKLKNLSQEAQSQLFTAPSAPPGPTNPATQAVNDLSDIALAARKTMQSAGNNSNSAAHGSSGLGRIMTAIEMGNAGHEMAGFPGRVAGIGAGLMAPNLVGKASGLMVNPLMSRLYSTELAPFSAPSMYSPNALAQYVAPDRRTLPGGMLNSNQLLQIPAQPGNAATQTRR